jgi:hypothetical protein
VYDPEAFQLTDRLYRETSTVCWLIAKIARPSLALPEALAAVVELAEPSWKTIAESVHAFLAADALVKG